MQTVLLMYLWLFATTVSPPACLTTGGVESTQELIEFISDLRRKPKKKKKHLFKCGNPESNRGLVGIA